MVQTFFYLHQVFNVNFHLEFQRKFAFVIYIDFAATYNRFFNINFHKQFQRKFALVISTLIYIRFYNVNFQKVFQRKFAFLIYIEFTILLKLQFTLGFF